MSIRCRFCGSELSYSKLYDEVVCGPCDVCWFSAFFRGLLLGMLIGGVIACIASM